MGRIVAQVSVVNALEPEKQMRFDSLVDPGSSFLVLPRTWKDRLGRLTASSTVEMETADQRPIAGEVCGPVRIEVECFRPIHSEVVFVEMHPADGIDEPLLGYVVLEQAGIVVDTIGHRLVSAKHMDPKRLAVHPTGLGFPRDTRLTGDHAWCFGVEASGGS